MLSFWFVIIINLKKKNLIIADVLVEENSTFSIPKLLCRILNEYSNGSLGFPQWKSVFIWGKWHEPFIKHVENGNQGRGDMEGGPKYTSIDDEDLNKAEKVIQSWSDNTNFSRCVTAENLSLLPLCIICYPFELWISWLQWLFLNVNEAKLKCNFVADE